MRRRFLNEGFDFNDSEEKAEIEAANEVDEARRYYQTYGMSKEEVLVKVKSWCDLGRYNGWFPDFKITPDGIVFSSGTQLTKHYIKDGKIPYKIYAVNGAFWCNYIGLLSLENCPDIVLGDFSCENNHDLTSLKGGPKEVRGNYFCDCCKLTSLEGIAKTIGKDLYAYGNQLESLDGIGEVKGRIHVKYSLTHEI